MQQNILWKSDEYHSLENCLVDATGKGVLINSLILGYYGGKIFRVDYDIRTDENWQTLSCEVTTQHSDRIGRIVLERDESGNWQMNGEPAPGLAGCFDVDIPLTPFTNTLPIKRLRFTGQESRQIDVVYLDLLADQVSVVRQQYCRLWDDTYRYRNVPNDFEAQISVDTMGLVMDYPSLFQRVASLDSHYT